MVDNCEFELWEESETSLVSENNIFPLKNGQAPLSCKIAITIRRICTIKRIEFSSNPRAFPTTRGPGLKLLIIPFDGYLPSISVYMFVHKLEAPDENFEWKIKIFFRKILTTYFDFIFRKVCSTSEVLEEILEFYLEHKDPIRKSVRVLNKLVTRKVGMEIVDKRTEVKAKNQMKKTRRPAIPIAIKHKVMARDKGQCTYRLLPASQTEMAANPAPIAAAAVHEENRCTNTRWVDLHHKIPMHLGGAHIESNITTLCASHHKLMHHKSARENKEI